MCRQVTTWRFWIWKAVKYKDQAAELRPASAGQPTANSAASIKARVGVGTGEEGGGIHGELRDASSQICLHYFPASNASKSGLVLKH